MRALVLAVALLGSAAATAQADTTQPGSYQGATTLDAGPVLVGGDRIAWAAERAAGANEYVTRLYSAPIAGGDVADHGQITEWTDDDEYSEGTAIGTLAGGNGNLAWLTYGWSVQAGKFGSGYFNHQISTLTRDGKLTKVCGPGETGTMSLAGDTLGISGCDGVTVRDLSRPDVAPVQLAPTGGWTQVAGSYVAWWTATGVELLDRATGTRTTLDTTQLSPTRRQLALSPEGRAPARDRGREQATGRRGPRRPRPRGTRSPSPARLRQADPPARQPPRLHGLQPGPQPALGHRPRGRRPDAARRARLLPRPRPPRTTSTARASRGAIPAVAR